jgi:hypothetical protein
MTRLSAVIAQAIVHHYGRDEFLARLAHPFWFQSFGAVMGMDWHSSGITTSVIGALKRGLKPLDGELGLHVCGGRGKHSRQTPQELAVIGERSGFDGGRLATANRLVAKVDSAAHTATAAAASSAGSRRHRPRRTARSGDDAAPGSSALQSSAAKSGLRMTVPIDGRECSSTARTVCPQPRPAIFRGPALSFNEYCFTDCSLVLGK